MAEQQTNSTELTFKRKVWITCSIAAFVLLLLLFIKNTFNVFLLIGAGALIAIYFYGLSGLIQRKTKWKSGVCLLLSICSTIIIIAGLSWLIGSKVQSQTQELMDKLPKTVQNAKAQLSQSTLGRKVVEKISSDKTKEKVQSLAQTFFKSTFGILGDLYVVLFLAIFFISSPETYKKGLIKLVPPEGKKKTETIFKNLSTILRKWLKGKLFAMLVVFILTATGLLIMGIPLWLTLALLAGLLNFIPNFGPLIALIPAVLIGFLQGPMTALWIAVLYIGVQVAESNFITPMVQKRLINIPPAMIIIAQLLIAPFTGGWGLVLATPLLIMIMVIVNELWIKEQ